MFHAFNLYVLEDLPEALLLKYTFIRRTVNLNRRIKNGTRETTHKLKKPLTKFAVK